MKYLVTGGSGFVGSHLVDNLLLNNHQVLVLDNLSTGRIENLKQHQADKNLEVIEGSILDQGLVNESVARVDRVFHLAAAVGVFNVVQHPLESLTTNIKGSENLFEASLKFSKPILITSSSEIYGKNTADQLSEDDDRVVGAPQKIRWSYSDAKAIDESMAIALNHQKGLETRIVRLFNTVGPRQVGFYGMVVPRFVEAALKGEPITIYGTGNQTRCFGHVLDVIDAIVRVEALESTIGRPINIGVNQEISIIDLANKVLEITGSKSKIIFQEYEEAYAKGFEDMERRVPNNSLLRELTGWSPTRNINQIITDLISHLKLI